MQISFEVGLLEKHQVQFNFSQLWGGLWIKVDGVTIIRDFRLYSLKLNKVYDFVVGSSEKHEIRIEKRKSQVLGGIRPQPVRVFIDGSAINT